MRSGLIPDRRLLRSLGANPSKPVNSKPLITKAAPWLIKSSGSPLGKAIHRFLHARFDAIQMQPPAGPAARTVCMLFANNH